MLYSDAGLNEMKMKLKVFSKVLTFFFKNKSKYPLEDFYLQTLRKLSKIFHLKLFKIFWKFFFQLLDFFFRDKCSKYIRLLSENLGNYPLIC
jgi:hypothetical protein